jgi:hypothetical protein
MYFPQSLSMLVLALASDGSFVLDAERSLAEAVFAREFPDDARDLLPTMIVEVVES